VRTLGPRRPTSPRSEGVIRPARFTVFRLVLLLILAIVLAPVAFYAQFSGFMQWVLGLAILGVLAGFAGLLMFRGASEPAPLVNPAAGDRSASGELARVAAAVGRATRGLPFSQVVVTSRARAAFLDQARLSFGWDPDAMRALQRDRAALGRLFDNVLADFLYLRSGDLDERSTWALRAQGRGGFAKEFGDVLERMEAWR
jgi:hypothetical protein